jgi:hypothetical protein
MTYIKDLIHIPDHVGRGDFVLRLSEGITDPEGTVKHYQVTPQLVKCFDDALNLMKSSLLGGVGGRTTSKAAYLHGSFGSGKSHFMAILHLILAGNSHARSIPELADVIAKHSDWMEGKKFLMVPYHLLGAKNLESAILGGYADYIARTHKEAPTASVFLAEGLLENAEQQREALGDAKFFAMLNKGVAGGSGGWGNISAAWEAVSYTEALKSPHNSEPCRRLVRDLVETHFPAMKNTEEFVDLEDGLAVISSHAKEIGYDAVVLFLDELVLWLATHAADPAITCSSIRSFTRTEPASASAMPGWISMVAAISSNWSPSLHRIRSSRSCTGERHSGRSIRSPFFNTAVTSPSFFQWEGGAGS